MNALVVYDSQYGNTERIAQAIAETFSAYGLATAVRIDAARSVSLHGIDLLVVGSPTQGFRPTPATLSWLESITPEVLRSLAVACFDTRFRGRLWQRSAAIVMARQLRTREVELVVPPESFFVKAMKKEGPLLPGELARADTWTQMLVTRVQAAHPALHR